MDVDGYFEDPAGRDWERADHDGALRLAVIGLGGFAERRALPAIGAAEHCEASVLVSGSPETADRLAAEHGADRAITYEAYHDGVAADAYDAAYVCTPNARHLEYIRTAADLGTDVLCEKPLESTAERAAAAVDACEDAGVALMVAYRLQVDPAIRRVRELVRDGLVGDPVHVHGQFSVHLLAGDYTADDWRLDPALAGGGALVDVGIYPINTTRFLLDADPVAAQGTTATPDPAFDGVDQHAAFQLDFPDDVAGVFTASFDAQEADWLRITGTEGEVAVESAFYSGATREITVERGLDERLTYAGPGVNEIREEVDYFADRVRSGAPIEPDGADGLADVRTIEAIYEAAETGRRTDC